MTDAVLRGAMNQMKKAFGLIFLICLIFTSSQGRADLPGEALHPIVCGSFLLGGSTSGRWLQPKEVAPGITGGESYRVYSPVQLLGYGTGGKVSLSEIGGMPLIEIKSAITSKENNLAVCGEWNALPRIPKLQSNENAVYINIIADILKQNGLSNAPLKIVQHYRIDLEGDGVEEVLIKAEHMPLLEPVSKKGTYSLILLRKIVQGKVENILIEKEFHLKDTSLRQGGSSSYQIVFLADLNGDGLMEMIIGWRYYEGLGYRVYEIKNHQVKMVLESGMGA